MNIGNKLQVYLCKIQTQDLIEDRKIYAQALKSQQIKNSSIITIKNGIGNFYRQALQFTNSCQPIYINIKNSFSQQILATFVVQESLIEKMSGKKNSYEAEVNGFRLFWQAHIKSEYQDQQQFLTQKDKLQYFNEQILECNSFIYNKTFAYFSNTQQKRIVNVISKNNSQIFLPSSLNSAVKHTDSTTNQSNKIRKASSDLSIGVRKIEKKSENLNIPSRQFNNKPQKAKYYKKIYEDHPDCPRAENQIIKLQLSIIKPELGHEKNKSVRTLVKSLSKKELFKGQQSQNKTNRQFKQVEQKNQKKLKKCRSGVFSKMSYKYLFSTAVIGVFSGIAASHI